MTRKPAFTLIELLTVSAIVAILAAIAVPNFLEAQVRSKVSRMESDMAVVAAALRAYYADHNAYPPNHPLVQPFLQACALIGPVNVEALPTPPGAPLRWTTRRSFPGQFGGGVMFQDPGMGFLLEPDSAMVSGRPGASVAPVQSESETTMTIALSDKSTTKGIATADNEVAEDFTLAEQAGGSFWFGNRSLIPSGYPVLEVSGDALVVLTTPVAYFTRTLPVDTFSDKKNRPIYVNYSEALGANSLLRDDGKTRRYLLLSFGPNTDQKEPDFVNPITGPFIPYDPTNGAVSEGDLFRFGY